jgi:hypothetical protein
LILFLKGLAQQIREVHLCDRFPCNRIVVHARACTPHAAVRVQARVGLWCESVAHAATGHSASGLVAHGCFALRSAWLRPMPLKPAEQRGWVRAARLSALRSDVHAKVVPVLRKARHLHRKRIGPKNSCCTASTMHATDLVAAHATKHGAFVATTNAKPNTIAQTNTTLYDADRHRGPSPRYKSSRVSYHRGWHRYHSAVPCEFTHARWWPTGCPAFSGCAVRTVVSTSCSMRAVHVSATSAATLGCEVKYETVSTSCPRHASPAGARPVLVVLSTKVVPRATVLSRLPRRWTHPSTYARRRARAQL